MQLFFVQMMIYLFNEYRYLFSSSTSATCQDIPTLKDYAYSQIQLSQSTFVIHGISPTSPYNLHFYDITFGSTSANWANKIVWPTASCTSAESEMLLSADGTKIYSFFTYGDSSAWYPHFVTVFLMLYFVMLFQLYIWQD